MLINSGESGHPCLVPDLRGNAFSFSPLRIMFFCRLIIYGLYYVEVGSFYAHFLKSFNHKLVLKETRVEKYTCIPLFIAALFTIARTWKQPKCLSTDEWIKKLWYIYTIEYYSSIKRNAFESVLTRWMNLEPIIQSEVSQKEKDIYRNLTHIYGILKNGSEEFIYTAAMEKQT